MKLARYSRLLLGISRFGSQNGFHSNFYSTKAMPAPEGSTEELYRRISKVSVVPILDQWIEEGRSIDEQSLRSIIRKLRNNKRDYHALEISRWMTEKQRLQFISEAQGREQAEKHFYNELHRYATSRCVEKAEAVMQKMRDLGFAMGATEYNAMLNLYYKTESMEKLGALVQEMEENGIVGNKCTLPIKLKAYIALREVEEMDKIVAMLESDSEFDWTNYTVAVIGYKRVGLLNKAFEMLKKAEARLTSETDDTAYFTILTQYASIGKKDEVLRVWSLYKKKNKVCNHGYECILSSLVKLDGFEMAEEIFDEWESQDDLTYDIRILHIILLMYSKKGLVEKAEALIDRAISKGGIPNASTWCHLFEGYFANDQPEKALEILKKAEACITQSKKTGENVFCHILRQYTTMGKKDDVLRVWSLFKKKHKVSNHGYKCILSFLAKLGDFEMEEIFDEWESQDDLTYDIIILNTILRIYSKKGLVEKAEALIDRAILKGGIPDAVTWCLLCEGCFQNDQPEKGLEILKKAEACITQSEKTGESVFCDILRQYTTLGKKDDVLRVWSLFKKKHKVFNYGYECILSCFVKLGDFEMAEEVFDEWESRDDLTYNMDIPNIIVGAYSRKGLMEKAEALIDASISKGGKPNASTWETLAEGYLQNQQPQKAVEMMKKAVVISETGWKLDMTLFKACLEYLEGIGDTEQTAEFANLLQGKDRNIVSLN